MFYLTMNSKKYVNDFLEVSKFGVQELISLLCYYLTNYGTLMSFILMFQDNKNLTEKVIKHLIKSWEDDPIKEMAKYTAIGVTAPVWIPVIAASCPFLLPYIIYDSNKNKGKDEG